MSLFRCSSRAKRLRTSPVTSTDFKHVLDEVHSSIPSRAEAAPRRRRRLDTSYTTGIYISRSGRGGTVARQRRFRVI
ncbi:MAG TPA: hypothetical protein VIL60_08425 [Rhodanobacter sp.]